MAEFGSGGVISTSVDGLPGGDGARSVFAWVKFGPPGGDPAGHFGIHAYGNVASNGVAHLFVQNGLLSFSGNGNDFQSSLTLPQGGWHLVGYTYSEGASEITLWIDGQAQTGPLSGGIPLNTVPDIGQVGGDFAPGPTMKWPGQIENVQLYGTSLQVDQIAELFAAGPQGQPVPDGVLLGWWSLFFDSRDHSGGNDGTAVNVTFPRILQLGDGNDTLTRLHSADALRWDRGGGGNDTLVYNAQGKSVVIALGFEDGQPAGVIWDAGVIPHLGQSGAVTGSFFSEFEKVNLNASNAVLASEFETVQNPISFVVTGDGGANIFDASAMGSSTRVFLNGLGGADTLIGGAGDDELDGGTGADEMDGGAGNDLYRVDNPGDRVFEDIGGGTNDRVVVTVSYQLMEGQEIERLLVASRDSTNGINLTGNEFRQQIFGNAGHNIIDGRGGADTMTGYGGNDTYYVDNVGDRVIEAADGGTDRVFTSVDYALGAGQHIEFLEAVRSSSTAPLKLTGNEFGQTLRGNAGANLLDGRGGADVMQGLGGDDTYIVDHVSDRVIESPADWGHDVVMTSVSYRLAAGVAVEELRTTLDTGTDPINLTGNEFEQTLVGNAGANVLNGGGGADWMFGGGGDDTYYVDHRLDFVHEAAGGGKDQILASVSYRLADASEIERLTTTNNAGTQAIDLAGNGFSQTIVGNAGNNVFTGHGGGDVLRGLGGADRFVYTAISDSTPGAAGRDRIEDFTDEDIIDLSAIDPNSTAPGNQNFLFIGDAVFTGVNGELRFQFSGSSTLVQADIDGDRKADFEISLAGNKVLDIDHFAGVVDLRDTFNGHRYLAVVEDAPISWLEAAQRAEALGGHLVTITSAEENDFVFGLVDTPEFWSPNGLHGAWLGGYQPAGSAEPGGGWRWVTDEAFDFTAWNSGEPNEAGGGENALHFHIPNNLVPVWNDIRHDADIVDPDLAFASYVVEFDGLSSHVPSSLELLG